MRKKLTTTTATYPLGLPVQSRLLTLPAGEYAGRRVAIMQTTPDEIKLAWSDSPSVSWSPLQTVVSDCANQTFDFAMAANNDIHLVYIEVSTGNLVTRRLQFVEGQWSVGDKVTIFNGGQSYDPGIAVDRNGRIWVTYSHYSAPVRTVYSKSSVDFGASWGSSADIPGDQIIHAAMYLWSKIIAGNLSVYIIYVDQDTGLYMRTRPLSGDVWSEPQLVATGSFLTRDFDVAMSSDGRLGVVFQNNGLYFREFDGNLWGNLIGIDSISCSCPQLRYRHGTPLVTWLKSSIDLLVIPMYALKRGNNFTEPALLNPGVSSVASLLLFCHDTQSYADRTSQAYSFDVADITHPDSGALVGNINDAFYVGMDAHFNQINLNLSTAGVGGTVSYSYWNGTQWQTFVPQTGGNALDASFNEFLLWTDQGSIPQDWQKCNVDGHTHFWVRIVVTSDFFTPPIGTYINAASEIISLILGR